MNAQPVIPTHLALFSSFLGCLLVTGCASKNVPLDSDTPAGDASGVSTGAELVLELKDHIRGDIVVDDERLYWTTTNGALQSCLKDDCSNAALTYTEDANAYAQGPFAVSAGNIFWLGDAISTCPTSGCVGAPARLIQDPAVSSQGVAAHAGHVYWLSAVELYSCAASGCGAAPKPVPFGDRWLPRFFRGNAYWLDVADGPSIDRPPAGGSMSIQRASEDGSGDPTIVVAPDESPNPSFALGGQHLYWLNNGNIWRCPLAGCQGEAEQFEPNATTKVKLRADDSGVYWTEEGGDGLHHDAVHYCSHDGCGDDSTFATIEELVDYALDDRFIYLLDHVRASDPGFIHRVSKPE
jgi:hypothetical protein